MLKKQQKLWILNNLNPRSPLKQKNQKFRKKFKDRLSNKKFLLQNLCLSLLSPYSCAIKVNW